MVLGEPDITYYVPLAVGVLLLSFGTDYNLFVVGRIWQESDRRDIGPRSAPRSPRGPGDLGRRARAGGVLRDARDRPDRTVLAFAFADRCRHR